MIALRLLVGVGYYLSSSVNPLLYSVMSKRFRRGFRDMFSNRGGSAPSHLGTSGGAADHDGDKDGYALNRQSTRRGRNGGRRLVGQYQLHEWLRVAEGGGEDNGIVAVDALPLMERERGKKP